MQLGDSVLLVVCGCLLSGFTLKNTVMYNYKRLMSLNPTKLGEIVNSGNQLIEFYEHPIQGDEHPVIAVSHFYQLAANTDFYELDDMCADHKEYEPSFIDGKFYIGDFQHSN